MASDKIVTRVFKELINAKLIEEKKQARKDSIIYVTDLLNSRIVESTIHSQENEENNTMNRIFGGNESEKLRFIVDPEAHVTLDVEVHKNPSNKTKHNKTNNNYSEISKENIQKQDKDVVVVLQEYFEKVLKNKIPYKNMESLYNSKSEESIRYYIDNFEKFVKDGVEVRNVVGYFLRMIVEDWTISKPFKKVCSNYDDYVKIERKSVPVVEYDCNSWVSADDLPNPFD